MRQIKFRGKAKSNGEWVYGDLFRTHEKYHSPHTSIIDSDFYSYGYGNRAFVEVDPETVGQFTGLKDRDGKEVYEGDFCRIDGEVHSIDPSRGEPFDTRSWGGYVHWQKEEARFILVNKSRMETRELRPQIMKVIGNIHDNPELMED